MHRILGRVKSASRNMIATISHQRASFTSLASLVRRLSYNCSLTEGLQTRSYGMLSKPQECNPLRFQGSLQSASSIRHFVSTRPPIFHEGGRSAQRLADMQRKNRNVLAWALAVVLGTVGLSYASVPLYRIFCQVTGFGGTVRRVDIAPVGKVDDDDDDSEVSIENRVVQDRPLNIRFNADVSARVPWRFKPLQSEVVVLPGETALAFYLAENRSDSSVTGIATYNIAPAKAAIYFNKVQCFCFDEQRLKPGEELDMPVFFYIDPEFADDPTMSDVFDITLSYTFFRAEDVTPEQLLQAQALLAHQPAK